MQKEDFINRIINAFPSSFRDRNRDEIFDEYDRGISDTINFDKLYSLFAVNYDKAIAPRSAYFKQFYNECTITPDLWNMTEEQRSALAQIANWLNSEAYKVCLYSKQKAPLEIRQLFRKYNFDLAELDLVRISGKIETEAV